MSSSQIFIVRDDDSGVGLNLGGGQWTRWADPRNFGGDTIYPGFAVNKSSPTGSMTITFQGTSLALWGNSAGAQASQQFQVTIDNNQPYDTFTSDTNPQHYMQWYQSPLLLSGSHTILVDNMDGIALDYMVFTPGSDTPLTGKTLMIDDFYERISYSGNWQAVTDQTFDGNWDGGIAIGGFAFQNSSHRTSTVGDSLSFSFTGTNVSIYGIYPFNQHGSLSLSYTIDGGSSLARQFTSTTAPDINEQPNFQLLETGPLAAGNHTITMTLTANVGQTLFVDYILYDPSFDTISDMPNLTSKFGSTSTSTSTGATPGATSNSTSATSTALGSSQTSSLLPPASGNLDNTKNTPTGVIAGGVVAGIAALIILTALAFFLYRRRHFSTFPLAPNHVEPFLALPPISFAHTSSPSGKHSHLKPHPPREINTTPSSSSENVDELRRRVQSLAEENARLVELGSAPPAYQSL